MYFIISFFLIEDIKSFFDEFEWSSVIISYPTRRRYSVLMKNAKGIETEVGSLGVVKYCDAYGCQPEFWKFSLTRNLVGKKVFCFYQLIFI